MDINTLNKLEKTYRNATPEEIIAFALDNFSGSLAFATSLAWEDQAVLYMLMQQTSDIEIFTLDTGRLFQETYDTIEQTNTFFNISIRIVCPEQEKVEQMVNNKGINLFYHSVENRQECCGVRKTQPLQSVLKTKKAWITGLRREQSVTRFGLKKIEYDEKNGLIKLNPIADWTEKQTIDFVKSRDIPYNKLQDQGYRSIGCLPCTRTVSENEDIRAGRWWWEQPENKECGLHK